MDPKRYYKSIIQAPPSEVLVIFRPLIATMHAKRGQLGVAHFQRIKPAPNDACAVLAESFILPEDGFSVCFGPFRGGSCCIAHLAELCCDLIGAGPGGGNPRGLHRQCLIGETT